MRYSNRLSLSALASPLMLLAISHWALADDSGWLASHHLSAFGDIYAEGINLNTDQTQAFDGYVRYGVRSEDYRWEYYAIGRGAGDTRTQSDGELGQIYNDNDFFAGGGVDYLGLLPGLRLSLQVGDSFNLNSKLARTAYAGFDFRVGTTTYHEIALPLRNLVEEIYSDAFYFRRYRDAIATLQARTAWTPLKTTLGPLDLGFGPVLTAAGSGDTELLDFNDFAEIRLGARASVHGPISLSLEPQYVAGMRWERPTAVPNYHDVRVLLTAYYSF